jgi:hypothetical protein
LTEPEEFYETSFEPAPRPKSGGPGGESGSQSGLNSVSPGQEVAAILQEIQKLNRGFIQTALEDAQNLEFRNGALIATFGKEDMFVKRVRESGPLFRDIGTRLFGRPLTLEVKISGQVEERIDDAEAKRRQLRERAMQNPAARLIMEKTRAEVLWVKEKEGPASTPN